MQFPNDRSTQNQRKILNPNTTMSKKTTNN